MPRASHNNKPTADEPQASELDRRAFLGKGMYMAAGLAGLAAIAGCGSTKANSGNSAANIQKAYNSFVTSEIPGLPIEVVRGAAKEGQLNAYLLVPDYNKALVQAFQQKFPFVTVNATYLNGGPLSAKFLAEVRAGKSTADIAQFSSLTDAMNAAKQNFVKPYTVTSESKINMSQGVKGSIYPVTGELLTIVYNSSKTQDSSAASLKQWSGLLSPQWNSATYAVGEVLAGGTTQLLNYYFDKAFGTRLWQRIAKAHHGIYPGGNPEVQSVISGEYELAVGVPMSLAVAALNEGAPVHWTNPQPWLASPYAQFISSQAKHVNAAKLWQEFILTPTAQGIITKSGGITYRKGFQGTGAFTKNSWYQPVDPSQYWRYSVQDLGSKMPQIAQQWRSIIT